jgi:hypothetical protein
VLDEVIEEAEALSIPLLAAMRDERGIKHAEYDIKIGDVIFSVYYQEGAIDFGGYPPYRKAVTEFYAMRRAIKQATVLGRDTGMPKVKVNEDRRKVVVHLTGDKKKSPPKEHQL